MSIRTNFILTLIFCLAAMAVSVAIAARLYAAQESNAAFQREASAQLDRIDDIIRIYFRGAEEAVKNLSTLPEARNAALIKSTNSPADGSTDAALRQRLETLPTLVPGVEAAFCGYKNGLFLSNSPAAPGGFDARIQSWYAGAAWSVTDASVTDITISETSRSLIATVAAKIKDANGETLGVAALAMNLGPLTDALRDIRLGKTGYLVLFDAKGRVLFDPKAQENLLRPAAEADKDLLPLVQLPHGLHKLSRDGVATAAVSRQFDGSRWKAAILMERNEQTGPGGRAAQAVTIVAAASALVLGLLGLVFAFGATRPLYALIRQSKALAEGDNDALRGIPGRGPDITALQGYIGQLMGRIMLLGQAEKEHIHEMESYVRKALAAEQEQTDKSARDAYHAACGNAARTVIPVAEQAAEAASTLLAWADNLREHIMSQIQAAANARTAAQAILNDTVTMGRQAAETEKSAEITLLLGQKAEKLMRDTTRILENIEETARSLEPGLEGFRADTDRMAVQAVTVRDIAEEVNVLGLNLSIEVSSAGEAGRPFLPMTEKMRSLAEKMMTTAGKMEEVIAALNQTYAAHALAVNKNTAVVRRLFSSALKTTADVSRTMTMAATTVEQIRVLGTALEGMAQEENLRPENAEACFRAAQGAEDALIKFHGNADTLNTLAASLTSLANNLASGPEEEEIILSFPRLAPKTETS